jgi:hypothetical protein
VVSIRDTRFTAVRVYRSAADAKGSVPIGEAREPSRTPRSRLLPLAEAVGRRKGRVSRLSVRIGVVVLKRPVAPTWGHLSVATASA